MIELAAIALHGPAVERRIVQRFAVEAVNPGRFALFDSVAETRGFGVLDDAHAGQAAIDINPDQQVNAAAVAVRRDTVENHRYRFAVETRAVSRGGLLGAEQRCGRQAQGIGSDIVVEFVSG